jgi:hypothetical protein
LSGAKYFAPESFARFELTQTGINLIDGTFGSGHRYPIYFQKNIASKKHIFTVD